MLFNSLDFAIFLPLVFLLYWFVFNKNIKQQNLLVVVASYVFYGWWDWRFLSFILFSTVLDFYVGIFLSKLEDGGKRKVFLWLSIIVNLGFLGFFKYYNFFVDSFVSGFSIFGFKLHADTLNIVLPVGISFYTFQTLSYSIDVYKRKLQPTKDFIAFATFVSFFPQLVAGPIERATHLLPQFYQERVFDRDKAVNGMRQILWGFFKKIVIADNCAFYANQIFNNSEQYSGLTLLFGAIFFTIQIYCDFSGYSDIAIGTSRLFGIDIMQNFAFPYFSRDIAEFWRRWHISLSTWFRDYIYFPLGGSRVKTWKVLRNTIIVFIVSGFWHGANWTFIVWGALNALYIMPLIIFKSNRQNLDVVAAGKVFPSVKELFQMLLTFGLVVLAWIFFRAKSVKDAIEYIHNLFVGLFQKHSYIEALRFIRKDIPTGLLLVLPAFFVLEWIGRENKFAIETVGLSWKRPYRYAMYYAMILVLFLLHGKEQQFIYFQF